MNKLNILFIIISLFIATNCKLRGEREVVAPPSSGCVGSNCGYDSGGGTIGDDPSDPGYRYPDVPNDPPADCYKPGVTPSNSGYLPEYRRIPVIGHGNPGGLSWSSYDDLRFQSTYQSGNTQNSIFVSDAKFDLRIVVKNVPSRGIEDSLGRKCNYENHPFSKIKFNLGIRDNFHSNNFNTIPFELDVGKCTRIYHLSDYLPNTHSVDQPIILDISGFQTNATCVMYEPGSIGYEGNYCGSNPYRSLPDLDCFEIELQLSTDTTKDLPY